MPHDTRPQSGADASPAPATPAPSAHHPPPLADRVERLGPSPVDKALNLLLLEVERDLHVGLTVSVRGTVVGGTLISRVEYFRAVAAHFLSHDGTTEMSELFASSLHDIVDDAQRRSREELLARDGLSEHDPVVEFLHFADARYIAGSGFMPHGRHGVLFRCRVADVSGWSLGDLTET